MLTVVSRTFTHLKVELNSGKGQAGNRGKSESPIDGNDNRKKTHWFLKFFNGIFGLVHLLSSLLSYIPFPFSFSFLYFYKLSIFHSVPLTHMVYPIVPGSL